MHLADWTPFYTFVGATAAALLGLIFLVVTLAAGFGAAGTPENRRTFILPIIRNLVAVLVIACLALAPIIGVRVFGAGLAILGVLGIVQSHITWPHILAHHLPEALQQEHWRWHVVVTDMIGGLTIGTGSLLIAAERPALYLAGIMTVAVLVTALRDTWRVLEYIVDVRSSEQKG